MGIATDAQAVYFTDVGGGTVNSVPKGGGAITQLATNQTQPTPIAVDDAYVYWASGSGNTVFRTLKNGGDTVHAIATTPGTILTIAVDATSVYILDATEPVPIQRAPKDGSGPVVNFASYLPGLGINLEFSQMVYNGSELYALGFQSSGSNQFIWLDDVATGAASEFGETSGGTDTLAASSTFVGTSRGGGLGAFIQWFSLGASFASGSISTAQNVTVLAAGSCGFVWAGIGESSPPPVSISLPTFGPVGLKVSTLDSLFGVPILATALPNQIVVDNGMVYWTPIPSLTIECPIAGRAGKGSPN